jgi:hypothetical protein
MVLSQNRGLRGQLLPPCHPQQLLKVLAKAPVLIANLPHQRLNMVSPFMSKVKMICIIKFIELGCFEKQLHTSQQKFSFIFGMIYHYYISRQ